MKYISSRKRGFTLIELLVAVSIVSVLSSMLLVAISGSRARARDASRISDLHMIQQALELYYAKYGYYPSVNENLGLWYACPDQGAGGGDNAVPNRDGFDCNGYRVSSITASWNKLQSDLAEFLPMLPKDPINNCTVPPWSNTPTPDLPCYAYLYGNVGRPAEPGPKTSYPSSYDLIATLEDSKNPLRSEVHHYHFYFNPTYNWDSYPYGGPQIYDIGDRYFGY